MMRTNGLRSIFISALGVGVLGSPLQAETGHQIQVMTYNVENLFDTQHDQGKEDYTYLPLSEKNSNPEVQRYCEGVQDKNWKRDCFELDWSEEVINVKMERIAQVILAAGANGQGPDVVVLPEVENINILNRLNEHLQSAGYQSVVLLEGEDERGIDVGMLSKLPLAKEPQLHRAAIDEKTRGILEASFILPNSQRLTIFGVHFPSPHNPTENRIQSFKQLNALGKQATATSDIVMAAGDFNVTRDESDKVMKNVANPVWRVSHFEGCGSCEGTNYFPRGNSWSFLDAILLFRKDGEDSPSSTFDNKSIHVVRSQDYQVNREGRPVRFDPVKKTGVSDHLPMSAAITLKP